MTATTTRDEYTASMRKGTGRTECQGGCPRNHRPTKRAPSCAPATAANYRSCASSPNWPRDKLDSLQESSEDAWDRMVLEMDKIRTAFLQSVNYFRSAVLSSWGVFHPTESGVRGDFGWRDMDSVTVAEWRGLGADGAGFRNCPWNDDGRHTARSRSIHSGVQGHWIFWLMRWQAEMDSATARGMTKFGFGGYFGNDGRRVAEDRDALALPTPSYCAKSQYP